jgi:hypothetical protein
MASAIELEDFVVEPRASPAAEPEEHLDKAGWSKFLAREIAATLKVFRTKPKLLLSQVRDERQIADDYAGRELLELVQNAADAAAERGGQGRVLIEIDRDGLVVANTGEPFRTGGVESLMTPHASDKPNRKIKLIGSKGLGFRALLNWSHEPIISSGELEIGFSEEYASTFVEALAEQVPQIAKICDDEEDLPVPILGFPASGAALDRLPNDGQRDLLHRARELRKEHFDTVVAAPFYDEGAFDWALKQADEFEPTFLLFVEALEEIDLRIAGRPPLTWRRRSIGSDTYALEVQNGEHVKERQWICLRKAGELTLRGRSKPRFYELAVALACDERNAASYLHSYFPTNIPVPFAVLFHATLELDSNRKAIKQNSDVNQHVLAELASFYAGVLERLVKRRRIANALDFLHRDMFFPEPLQEFEQLVYKAVRPLKVIPNMRGGRVSAAETSIGPAGYQNYLPTRLFGGLAKTRSHADRNVLDRLGVETLSPAALVRTLRRSPLSLEERAKVIAGIACNLNSTFHDRGLFIDQNGQRMQGRNTLFPPPSNNDRLPRLPEWAKARFIDPKLWKLVLRKTDGNNFRDKLRRLSGFGISEYSNESVIASLRSQATRALQSGRRDPDLIRRELLCAIYGFYSPEHRKTPVSFAVFCRDGQWRDAREVHLSEVHGQAGRINAALYRSAPHLLLGTGEENGLDGDPPNSAAFFEWIGVNRWPRLEKASPPADLRDAVLRSLPATIAFEDGTYRKTIDKRAIQWGHNFEVECSMIAGLDAILRSAESDAILAWLASDPRFDLALPTHFGCSARGRVDGKAAYRPFAGKLPDLVRERIATVPWLACRDDSFQAPRDAMIEPGSLAELFHIPRSAAVGSEERFGLTRQAWRRGLEHAQVPRSLSDLPEGEIYGLLRRLCDRQPSEAVVRALYSQVLALENFDRENAPLAREEFISAGKVQVRRARTREWVRPADALYADQTGFPAAVRETLAIIDLPPRRNSGNVLDRFGVSALSQKKYSLAITRLDEIVGAQAAILRTDFAAARPFIRALRLADSNVTARLRRFDRLDLVIASAVEIAVVIGDQRIEGALERWSHVLVEDRLIVLVDSTQSPVQLATLAHEAIADGIAEVLDLQSGADFAKLLSAQDDSLRRMLVRRMLSNLSEAEIEALLAEIPASETTYEPVPIDPQALLEGPLPATDQSTPTHSQSNPASSNPRQSPFPATPHRPQNPQAIIADPFPVLPVVPKATPQSPVRLRIARATGPVSNTAHPDPYRASDAEEWTKLFELSESRVPLAVLHLQGTDSFGCDWLSFASEDDRDQFISDPARTELVLRFIETKSGAIELSDNQSRAAELRRERYFVYRFHFYAGQRDFAELTIVRDPLAHRHALSARFEFQIDAVETRELYHLKPVTAEEA